MEERNRQRINEIDGLRGIACVCIVLGYHCRTFFFEGKVWMDNLAYFVEVFFIISGFMMAYNYKNRIYMLNFKSYFLKRYINLMCIYWITDIVWIVLLAIQYSKEGIIDNNSFNLLYLTLEFWGVLSGWGFSSLGINSWFFCVLIYCYIIYFILCKYSIKINQQNGKYIASLLAILVFTIVGIINAWDYSFLYAGITLRGLGSFLVGAIIYELYENLPEIKMKTLLYVFDFLIALSFLYCKINGFSYDDFLGNKSLTMILIICPLIVLNVLYIPIFRAICSRRFLLYLGKISMNIYLWHTIVLRYILKYNLGYISMVIISIVVGSISYYLLEPIIKNCLYKQCGIVIKS